MSSFVERPATPTKSHLETNGRMVDWYERGGIYELEDWYFITHDDFVEPYWVMPGEEYHAGNADAGTRTLARVPYAVGDVVRFIVTSPYNSHYTPTRFDKEGTITSLGTGMWYNIELEGTVVQAAEHTFVFVRRPIPEQPETDYSHGDERYNCTGEADCECLSCQGEQASDGMSGGDLNSDWYAGKRRPKPTYGEEI